MLFDKIKIRVQIQFSLLFRPNSPITRIHEVSNLLGPACKQNFNTLSPNYDVAYFQSVH